MAARASSEIVIDALPEVILDALADIDSLPLWSSVHKKAEVIDTYSDGRPHHVKVWVKAIGIADHQLLEFHWGPDWVVWDAKKTVWQHGQHAEYTLERESETRTRVRFDMTMEPSAPLPEFLINRGRIRILKAATEGLCDFVMCRDASGPSE